MTQHRAYLFDDVNKIHKCWHFQNCFLNNNSYVRGETNFANLNYENIIDIEKEIALAGHFVFSTVGKNVGKARKYTKKRTKGRVRTVSHYVSDAMCVSAGVLPLGAFPHGGKTRFWDKRHFSSGISFSMKHAHTFLVDNIFFFLTHMKRWHRPTCRSVQRIPLSWLCVTATKQFWGEIKNNHTLKIFDRLQCSLITEYVVRVDISAICMETTVGKGF